MATLEKFTYYKLFLEYVRMRFSFIRYVFLSVLIVILGATELPGLKPVLFNFVFVFISLFVFRFFDDAFSYKTDRLKSPERFYVQPGYFGAFIYIGFFVLILYLFFLLLLFPGLLSWILILLLASAVLYAVFSSNKTAMTFIPLLKYPVLIWCISGFSCSDEILFLMTGSFFMMLTVDFIQSGFTGKSENAIKFLLLSATGLLIIQPWTAQVFWPGLLMILAPMVILILKPGKDIGVFPAVIYPVMHFINILILP